jgi:hypothetical protein
MWTISIGRSRISVVGPMGIESTFAIRPMIASLRAINSRQTYRTTFRTSQRPFQKFSVLGRSARSVCSSRSDRIATFNSRRIHLGSIEMKNSSALCPVLRHAFPSGHG